MAKTTAKKTSPVKKRTTVKKSVASTGPKKKETTPKRTVAKRPARKQPDAHEEIRIAALKAAQYAIEKKATDVHLLDLTKITSMTDYFVVATGDSDRQVKAIAENVISEMRDREGISPWRSEGWDSLHWVLIDFVDFVVHIFHPDARLYYNIERLWADAPTIEVNEKLVKPKVGRKKNVVKGAIETDSKRKLKATVNVIGSFKEVGGASH